MNRTIFCFLAMLLPQLVLSAPLRIFILSGQSNMEGYARVGHLQELADDPITASQYEDARVSGNWIERDDVFIKFQTREGPLTVGYGNRGSRFGPELSFGMTVGDYFDEPVLLIKAAFGGTSLAVDWRPPSSAVSNVEYDSCSALTGICSRLSADDYGVSYRSMLEIVNSTIQNDLALLVPSYSGEYEISGFVWFQGFNDVIDSRKLEEYETNLAHLIRDVRRDLQVPDLPFIVGELGMQGTTARDNNHKTFREIQKRVTRADEFTETTSFVSTGLFSTNTVPSFDGESHYYGRADTIWAIGREFGRAVLEEINPSPTSSPQPSLVPTGLPSFMPSTGAPSLTPSFSPSAFPTPTDGLCDDDNSKTFLVPELNQNQRCIWLEARPDYIESLCVPGNDAYDICEETCGKCKDSCFESRKEKVTIDGIQRDCAWLSLRFSKQAQFCVPTHEAVIKCPETCNSCDRATSMPSINLAISPVPSTFPSVVTLPPTPRPTIFELNITISPPQNSTSSPRSSLSSAPSERGDTQTPTLGPSRQPSLRPSLSSVPSLSGRPSQSFNPSLSQHPSSSPTASPTTNPTISSPPTISPYPSVKASTSPTEYPSATPTTASPSSQPSDIPTTTSFPTITTKPTTVESDGPSRYPSTTPSFIPSLSSSPSQSQTPTVTVSKNPTLIPSPTPSQTPSVSLRPTESFSPTSTGSHSPSFSPTHIPTTNPTISMSPTDSPYPTMSPSLRPTRAPPPFPHPSRSPSVATSQSTRAPSLRHSVSPLQRPSPAPQMCRNLDEKCMSGMDCCSGVCRGPVGLEGTCYRSESRSNYKLAVEQHRGGAAAASSLRSRSAKSRQ